MNLGQTLPAEVRLGLGAIVDEIGEKAAARYFAVDRSTLLRAVAGRRLHRGSFQAITDGVRTYHQPAAGAAK